MLCINRAATCCQWSPKENKFAVGSAAKRICVCYYFEDNNWWISRLIKVLKTCYCDGHTIGNQVSSVLSGS